MKKVLVIFLIILGLVANPIFTFAQTANSAEIDELNRQISERKDKVKQLEDTIAKYEKIINQKRTESASLKNEISILDNGIAKAEASIVLTQEKIKKTQLEIDALQLTIADKEALMEKQKKIITKIVQNINADKRKNYLEVLLTNSNFAVFYDQLQYTMNVFTDLGQSIKVLRLIKEDLQTKQKQVISKKQSYEDLKAELEEKRDRLQIQTKAKEIKLAETKSSELKNRALQTSLKQQYQTVINEQRAYEDQVRKKLAQQNKLDTTTGPLSWPVPSHVVNALFHDPDYPFQNVFQHSGIDIRASQGTPVRAAASGYVARAKICSLASCYAYVLIIHTGSVSTLYGHLSQVNVSGDQFVNKGDVIGLSGGRPGSVGAGPFVTGPHLHFEVRLNGIPVDPMGYF